VTLNDLEWPFCVKFCFAPFVALKPGFRSLATLKLVVNVVGVYFKPKRTAAASRGFLATARFSCSVYKHSFQQFLFSSRSHFSCILSSRAQIVPTVFVPVFVLVHENHSGEQQFLGHVNDGTPCCKLGELIVLP